MKLVPLDSNVSVNPDHVISVRINDARSSVVVTTVDGVHHGIQRDFGELVHETYSRVVGLITRED